MGLKEVQMSYPLAWGKHPHVGKRKMDFVNGILHALSRHYVEGCNAWLLDWM